MLNNWRKIIQHTLLPFRCLLCGGPAAGMDLCPGCVRDLPWNRRPCPLCAAPARGPHVCGRCLRRPPAWHRAFAPLVYRFPVDRLVARYKYSGDPVAGRVLADVVAGAAIRRASSPNRPPECLVPVPLHPDRARERGFDQAEDIARRLGRQVGIPVRHGLLERVRPTRPQAGLPAAARRRNLRGAFRVAGVHVPKRLILVDDVLTTGATTAAAAAAMRRAGARDVEIWCVARAGAQRYGANV